MKNRSIIVLASLCLAVGVLGGCSDEYREVPPNYFGRILTHSGGWEDKIYTPGMVNIGVKDNQGRGNFLVLIHSAAFEVKEQFVQKSTDGEDHRILTKDETPMAADFRLVFTCPDVDKETERVKKIFTLGNPKKTGDRVMTVSLEDLYNDQARLHVRTGIRRMGNDFANFSDAFKKKSEFAIATQEHTRNVIAERKLPLTLVDCELSNLKPDELVRQAQVRIQAAQGEIESMKQRQAYLDANPTAKFIYKWDKLLEMVKKGQENGQTVVVLTDTGIGDQNQVIQQILPVLASKLLTPTSQPAVTPAPKK